MSKQSKIEWTGETWNPISGCSRKSDGCKNCYAETMTKRLEAMGQDKYTGLLNEHGRFNGVIKFDEKALLKPLSVKKPTTYFVNSMSDLFYENVKDEWIDKVFAVMALSPQHTFQVLTKRPERMKGYCRTLGKHNSIDRISIASREFDEVGNFFYELSDIGWTLPNVHLGVSCENQQTADERIPHLLDTPAAIRFLSCEPLLGEIKLYKSIFIYTDRNPQILESPELRNKIDWVIVGGESGNNARDCEVGWISSIVTQCKSANVPVFVKQLGAKPYMRGLISSGYLPITDRKGGKIEEFPQDLQIREMPR